MTNQALPYPRPLGFSESDATDVTDVHAITLSLDDLAIAIGTQVFTNNNPNDPFEEEADTVRTPRLFDVASEQVNRYAPLAPTAMKNEAVIRYAGYLAQSDYGGVSSESIGPRAVTYTPPSNNAAMFRNSGAAGILSFHRQRRAGAI